MEDPPAVQKQ
uniref:Uncharacterized protein n=1 Tax=Rhizophora mucronata TaxID=61149 RepID=A0A2P2PI38_RHIMU